ncbi:pentapeptide repeat-containing protein [Anabaena catenula]|uniref:Pentapeptide repeat-containing protein n=1 Tax=Anabaena catenula FACHB-362 TaxID=2692877 RepID=A0ABR8JBT1_9NOST|nr:pentapeptide repeat-containing protein [Anabaena catenula]MBD2694908.1 pentapeptide repeat-containing protein [Anabaena catenula FACHB-362]
MIWSNDRTDFDRNIAVIIGINDYRNGIHPLSTPINDATELAELLETQYEYQKIIRFFPPHNEATLENINKLLKETLPNQIRPTEGDRLVFYFAGHGIARNSEDGPAGYLIPQDADPRDRDTFLPMRDVNAALSKLDCHHLLVILDCCFAGNFRWSSSRNVIPIPETIHREHYDRFIRCSAWQAITSAAYNQEALDFLSDLRNTDQNYYHSPFALALIEGLKDNKADLTGDGVITAPELYLYLRDRLVSKDGISELQTPGLWPLQKHDRGEFIFTLPGFQKEQLTPAPPLNENNNPYQGLKPFEERHSHLFFGREELVKKLVKFVYEEQLTIVLGASGSGKSSLVKAGLVPNLRNNQTDNEKWYILEPMRPGEFPFTTLARSILPVADETLLSEVNQFQFIDNIFDSDIETEKIRKIAELWRGAESEKKLLLVIDYFNELNTLCSQQKQREQLSNFNQKILTCLNDLSNELKRDTQHFTNLVNQWSQSSSRTNFNLLLIIDQFEELVTLNQNIQEVTQNNKKQKRRNFWKSPDQESKQPNKQQEWQQLLKLLEEILTANLQKFRIVVTLRSDFEQKFRESDVFKSHWNKAQFRVENMHLDELRLAIERPASEMALYFEPPNLVDRLIQEVGQNPGTLPLLSFTLSELYIKFAEKSRNREITDRAIRIDAEFETRSVAGSLTRRANKEYEKLDDTQKATMRRVMLRMMTVQQDQESTRRRVPLLELEYADDTENERVKQVLEVLNNARLIVGGQETGEPYVEPAHDLLVQKWDKLRQWQEEEKEKAEKQEKYSLQLHRKLTLAAFEWRSKEKQPQFLWNYNPYLNVLRKELKSSNNRFNKIESDFIEKSIKQRRNNRLKFIGFGFIPLVALTIFIGFVTTREIIISQLRRTIEQAKGQKNSPTRILALQELVKLGVPLNSIQLAGADLSGADLSGADLSRADLSGADLSDADLSDADLSRADLSRADLSRAKLPNNLQAADLSDANLTGAKFGSFGVNLNYAKLTRANLTGATFGFSATFIFTDLSGANLTGVDFYGASFTLPNLKNAEFGCEILNNVRFGFSNKRCTNLSRAKSLDPTDIKAVKNWQQACYSPEFLKKLGLSPDNRLECKSLLGLGF